LESQKFGPWVQTPVSYRSPWDVDLIAVFRTILGKHGGNTSERRGQNAHGPRKKVKEET
jgi:hypothetical protein